MSTTTKIQWTDSTPNPLRARVKDDAAEIAARKGYTSLIEIAGKMAGRIGSHCEHVSSGCDICYSDTLNHRCLPGNGTGLPYDRRARDLVDMVLDERILLKLIRLQKPRKNFLCSMTDLFGDFIANYMIYTLFAVMSQCSRQTFQVLTKRPERMRELLTRPNVEELIERAASSLDWCKPDVRRWPLPNVWLGVSVEDQQRANERIPLLLDVPAAIHFVSYEPALEVVDFRQWLPSLDWVIIGGESGLGARPFDLEWAKSAMNQCQSVATFFKQAGARPRFKGQPLKLKDAKGGDLTELPEFCRVREFPGQPAAVGAGR